MLRKNLHIHVWIRARVCLHSFTSKFHQDKCITLPLCHLSVNSDVLYRRTHHDVATEFARAALGASQLTDWSEYYDAIYSVATPLPFVLIAFTARCVMDL